MYTLCTPQNAHSLDSTRDLIHPLNPPNSLSPLDNNNNAVQHTYDIYSIDEQEEYSPPKIDGMMFEGVISCRFCLSLSFCLPIFSHMYHTYTYA